MQKEHHYASSDHWSALLERLMQLDHALGRKFTIRLLTDQRVRHYQAREKEVPGWIEKCIALVAQHTVADWVRKSGFLSAQWLMKSPQNLAKFLEGHYFEAEQQPRQASESDATQYEDL